MDDSSRREIMLRKKLSYSSNPLIAKFFLQLIWCILVHSIVFYIIPRLANYEKSGVSQCTWTDPDCICFKNVIGLKIIYVIYCLYFFYSALQIREGYS